MNNKQSNKIFTSVIVLLILFIGFSSGYLTGLWDQSRISPKTAILNIINKSDSKNIDEEIDFKLFWKVWDEIDQNYYNQPIDERKMFYGALMGITAALNDPYSMFLNPELTTEFSNEMNGSFEGIGAEIGIRNDNLVVIAPLPGMPAQEAGLKSRDIVLKIDEVDTFGMSLDQAIQLIRGENGTIVKLTVKNENEDEIREIEITRGVIKYDSVRWEILEQKRGDIGYIEVVHFSEDTEALFNEAVNEILLANPEGIILDLRNNPGGYLTGAVNMTSKFLEDNVVLYEEFSDGSKKQYDTKGPAPLKGMKTVVLINGGSASASEIIAGALQDHKLATLIGETTFGKGSVQTYKTFDDGSSLKLTIAKWLTPNLTNIDEVGITPDIEIEMTEEDINNDNDPQLDKAKQEILK